MTMELAAYFQSVLEQDPAAVVICNLQHEIIYMNPAAIARYAKRGGRQLLGKSLLDCHGPASRDMIAKVLAWFAASPTHNRIYTSYNPKENKDVYMVALRSAQGELIGYYEKHEYRNPEQGRLYDFAD